MCKILKISRSIIYYKQKSRKINIKLETEIINIFNKNRKVYGTRRIKVELSKIGYKISRKKISQIMKKYNLVSKYTKKYYKVHKSRYNEEKIENLINREFNSEEKLEKVVSDLTYVDIKGKWHYICILLDIYNRKIIGYSAGKNKNLDLVMKAFSTVKYPLNKIAIFHTDRGLEFKNKEIDKLLKTFKIKRSLSKKGTPYDNAVAESLFQSLKMELIYDNKLNTLEELETELFDFVNWYNNIRPHSSLGYKTPKEYNK
jgi:transposase InsO family protein